MIEINHLCKSFGTLEVLKDISLTVKAGEIYGLVGRSGAGKSTLLRCINGLENYDSGSLKINGTEIRDLSKQGIRELRKGIGMIFQQFSLIERRSVYKNVALPMKCWKYDKDRIDKRVHELLELVDIADKINDRPSVLSGGQKQRVAIARALALDSNLLLCDEATASCIYTQKGNKKIRKPQAANQTALIFDRRAAARLLSINSIRRLCWS